ncbi:hypothetical protein BH23GEM9_BH23GEM9_05150 [soil metagenome]
MSRATRCAPLGISGSTYPSRMPMTRMATLACALTVWLAGSVTAQQSVSFERATAAYAAVLQAIPPGLAGRDVLVDPRVSLSFLHEAAAVDVWEQHLRSNSPDAVVRALDRSIEGLRYCADTPNRSRCLDSTQHLHVTFSAPVPVGNADLVVEATFVTRTFEDRTAFMIQTWRYSFTGSGRGLTLTDRKRLASGHGRLGG